MNKSYYSLGLMTGTSGDGVDASLAISDGKNKFDIIYNEYVQYPPDVYEEFHKLKNKRIAKEHNAKYFCMDINLGVSGGRNFGLRKAIGDIILEIDDDAEFESNDAIKLSLIHI